MPAANVKELIALAKAKPGQIRYASGGSGSSLHLAGELLKIMLKIVQAPEFKARMLAQATMVSGTTPEALARYLHEEIVKWAKVVKAAGIRVE